MFRSIFTTIFRGLISKGTKHCSWAP